MMSANSTGNVIPTLDTVKSVIGTTSILIVVLLAVAPKNGTKIAPDGGGASVAEVRVAV